MTIDSIPAINATLNGLATLLMVSGFILIKQGRKEAHRFAMSGAFLVSILFLILYVTHKILVQGVHTPFQGEGWIRPIYYTMLLTHIILAIAIVPLVLRTLQLAFRGDFTRHRAWARWTFPLWLYVSVTGVLIYFFLYQWFA